MKDGNIIKLVKSAEKLANELASSKKRLVDRIVERMTNDKQITGKDWETERTRYVHTT